MVGHHSEFAYCTVQLTVVSLFIVFFSAGSPTPGDVFNLTDSTKRPGTENESGKQRQTYL